MEKRIKVVYLLTIIAIITFFSMQGYWLYTQYEYTRQTCEDELYQKVMDLMHTEYTIRRLRENPNITVTYASSLQIGMDNMESVQKSLSIYIDVFHKQQFLRHKSLTVDTLNVITPPMDTSCVKKYHFKVDNYANEEIVFDAATRFATNKRNPFQIALLDSLFRQKGITIIDLLTEKTDSMVWNPTRKTESINGDIKLIATYPYDIFMGETVKVVCLVRVSPVLAKMFDVLLISVIVSILLITCLITQIRTIRKQLIVEKLRQDFIHTMIHELKRPIATLKMCFSFIRNEKMMEDKESKKAILEDSYHELNNLSSYFSKLRDITFNDVSEIPLNLSSVKLYDLLRKCVDKLNIPGDKNVSVQIINDADLSIIADKMHLENIINNLLENAIKYSNESVHIVIDYCLQDDYSISISIKDNGIGIPKAEIEFVFDKFFRSNTVSDKDIPGMGLGLAYVKLLIGSHKGEIYLESEEGVGSIFTIKIPQEAAI